MRRTLLSPTVVSLFEQYRFRFSLDREFPGRVDPGRTAGGFCADSVNGAFSLRTEDGNGDVDDTFAIVQGDVSGKEKSRFDGLPESIQRCSVGLHGRDRVTIGIIVFEQFRHTIEDPAADQPCDEDQCDAAASDESDDFPGR